MTQSAGSISSIERALTRDRWAMTVGIVLVAALAWAYTLEGVGLDASANAMTHPESGDAYMRGMPMAMPAADWTLIQAGTMLAMWWVMMVAMMLPSAAPTILLAAAINRRSRAERPPFGATGAFAAGYLLAWLLFSALAVAAQWWLQADGLLSLMMRSSSKYLTGGLLLAAGLWQFTSVKRACLRQCRSPVEFLTRRRKPGNEGALAMGLEHGIYCVGCCWVAMTLLFVGGVMNPYWIVALALYVLVEKLFPYGERIGQLAGIAMIIAAVAVLVT
jgi:predicted metal-binding membrane protein